MIRAVNVVTIKLLLPSFDRKDLDFVEDQFRHIHEELAMFTAFQTELPTQWKLIRNGKKVGTVKMVEKRKKNETVSNDLQSKSAQQS